MAVWVHDQQAQIAVDKLLNVGVPERLGTYRHL
jgi:hypothetical protein